jgi:mRNA interferase RelE/StbE
MMVKQILLSTIARKQFKALDKNTKKRIKSRLNELSKLSTKKRTNLDIKKLKGVKGREDLYRLRVGQYRILFSEESENIKVIQIIPRRRGYDWL